MKLLIIQVIIFLLWNFFTLIILYTRIKEPYKIYKRTKEWRIEKFNLITFNSFTFGSLGAFVLIIYQLWSNIIFNLNISILLTVILAFIYLFCFLLYLFEVCISLKVNKESY